MREAARSGVQLGLLRFSDHWFHRVSTYNKLMLSLDFYVRFSAYGYLLVYQLDAWVFSDELDN